MATHHPIRKTVAAPTPVIPDKLYFRIGDVARLCEVPAYVLRFWETEFPNLKPNKGGTGQRLYRRKDVETALRIKHLLYDLGYTIPGARQVFKNDSKPGTEATPPAALAAATPELAPAASHAITLSETPESAQRVELSQSKNTEALPSAQIPGIASIPALHALREELRALHLQLSAPITISETFAPTPLRPRLVAEVKPRPRLEPKPAAPKLGPVLFDQQDLFSAE
ncbi:MerR family transcriptional regulator [Granulicella paludicola]|uniref:MerR family transcriptional regulator n=1 Tax=Granulicella paludicola TaxID=474951 RepID=UPI0021E060DC|nr:MerR family transcriptional regulator [Granulicella paludicola]